MAKRKQVSVARINRLISKQINRRAELKQYMFDQGSTAASTTGTILNLSQFIVVGDDYNQRDGESIFLESVLLRLNYRMPAVTVNGSVRFILFQDKLATGAVPIVNSVLELATLNSTYDITNNVAKRFRILDDHTISMTSGHNLDEYFTKNYRIGNKTTYYGNTAIPGSNGRNSLYILIISNATLDYSFDAVMKFRDM